MTESASSFPFDVPHAVRGFFQRYFSEPTLSDFDVSPIFLLLPCFVEQARDAPGPDDQNKDDEQELCHQHILTT